MSTLETYLASLRARPEAWRQRLAFVGAASVTILIFLAWLVYFQTTVFNQSAVADRGAAATNNQSVGFWSRLAAGAAILKNFISGHEVIEPKP